MKNLILILTSALLLQLISEVTPSCCMKYTVVFALPTGETNCDKYGHTPTAITLLSHVHNLAKEIHDIIKRSHCIVKLCGDAIDRSGMYCGNGSCNALGCECDGGCVPGDVEDEFKSRHGFNAYWVPTLRTVIGRALDQSST